MQRHKSSVARGATRFTILVLGLLSFAGITAAQSEQPAWSGNIGFGFSPLVGPIERRLDNGWHTQFGAAYRLTSRFSIGGEVMYNGLGVSKGLLNELADPEGDAAFMGVSAEPPLELLAPHQI